MRVNFRQLTSYDRSIIFHFAKDLLRTPLTAVHRRWLMDRRRAAIGYIGWVGHGNLGDEAMFEQIKRSFADFKLVPLLPEPGERLILAWVQAPAYSMLFCWVVAL